MREVRCARSIRRAVAALALLGLAGCAGLGGPRVSSEERAAYDTTRIAGAGGPAAEAKALEAFLARFPDGALADDAGVRLAELELARGRREAARRRLEAVLESHPKGDRSATARLRLARLQLEQGDAEAAWVTARPLRLSLLDEKERRAAHALLAELGRRRGDVAQELHWLSRMAEDASDPKAAAQAEQRLASLVGSLDRAQLAETAERLERRRPAARLWLEAASRALDAGDVSAAEVALARAGKLPLSPEEARHHVTLEQALTDRAPRPAEALALPPPLADVAGASTPVLGNVRGTLGVVLPLSGSLADVGEESLRGILLAADVFGAGGEGEPGVRLLVRDSGGQPEAAAAAVEELAREEELSAVIGPLLAEEAQAAAVEAERARVPLLSLTRREEVAQGRPHVFRFGTTRRMEAEALAEYAVERLGARRFALLYPQDRYGREFRRLFWDAVEARGGAVVGVAGYAPDATDFRAAIRRLVGYELLSSEERALLKQRSRLRQQAKRSSAERAAELRARADALRAPDGSELPPIVDFDALFIPDAADKVALIAPQLAFHEVEDVRLLGPSGWYHEDLIRIGGRHVERAVFTSAFDPGSPVPLVREFTRRYERQFGSAPSVFSAESFDATNLALLQLLHGRQTPGDLRKGLLDARIHPGVSGVTAVRRDGNAAKRPFLVGVERGEFVPIP